jgi:hypothetical protein
MHAALQPSEQPPARSFLPPSDISACLSYRDAVRLAWARRRSRSMTKRSLAEFCGLYAPHVTDYLHDEPTYANGKKRLDLPASAIVVFEAAVGNKAITQYLVLRGALTIMEEVIQGRHP